MKNKRIRHHLNQWPGCNILQASFGVLCLGGYFLFSEQIPVLLLGLFMLVQAVFNWPFRYMNTNCQP